MRSQGAGVLTKEDALKLCAVGPTTRASGVKKDVRVDTSYFAYGDLDFEHITPESLTGTVNGDVMIELFSVYLRSNNQLS